MPNQTTPTIIRRYYPTLSSIINSDDINENHGGYGFQWGRITFKSGSLKP